MRNTTEPLALSLPQWVVLLRSLHERIGGSASWTNILPNPLEE
ncbi:hypothetical protein [Scytonema hofmannii]|nr:hypothetical protein [Scytonema hofmannii]